jgi:N-acetyl sugar amidotransferase
LTNGPFNPSGEPLEAYYGLPSHIVYCKRCVMSNQRPSSYPEFRHVRERLTPTLHLDEEGVCDACRFAERKDAIDWVERERQLVALLDQHRRTDGGYDCLVPGSGGKDSIFASHVLKYKYGMNPLTCTWPPILYTDIGLQNFRNWIEVGGFDNITFKPNGRAQRTLTRLAIENLLHPFQTFVLGQKQLAIKLALRHGIKLVFYGENEAEYGNPVADNAKSLRDKSYFAYQSLDEVRLAGLPIKQLVDEHGLRLNELTPYLPADHQEIERSQMEVHYLGYYLKWVPQEAYYYAAENCAFSANPVRTEGTYSKYNSLDDKIDGLHYYTTYIKFGLGRASYDASQELRNKHLTREEAVMLVQRFDGEFPAKYLTEVLDYIGLTAERFEQLCDAFRSPHLWVHENGAWRLRQPVWQD